jgi:hypothetical protein
MINGPGVCFVLLLILYSVPGCDVRDRLSVADGWSLQKHCGRVVRGEGQKSQDDRRTLSSAKTAVAIRRSSPVGQLEWQRTGGERQSSHKEID